jgi:hypothetical protein
VTYRILTPESRKEIQSVTPWDWPSTSISDTNNLVTTSHYFTNGVNVGKLSFVEHPNGTMTFYDYVTTSTNSTTTVSSGQPGISRTNIVDGTKTISTLGTLGQPLTNRVEAIRPGSTNILLSLDVYSLFDEFQRPQRVTHLDGSYEETYFSCCGVGSTRDRLGVTTYYLTDDLKRATGTQRLGITTTNVLNAAGWVLETRRIGTNGNTITQARYQYEADGSRKQEITALLATNSFSESFVDGFRIVTTIFHGGGTRVDTYYRDGRLMSTKGSSTMPVRYEYGTDEVDPIVKTTERES